MSENNLPVEKGEYKYSEEHAGDYAEPPSVEAINARIIKSRMKRMFIPMGLMLVVYIVYHLLSWYAGRKQHTDLQQEVIRKPVVTQVAKPNSSSQNTSSVAKAPVYNTDTVPAIEKIESIIRKDLNVLSQEINVNKGQVAELTNNVANNQRDIAQIKQTLDGLTTAVTQVAQQMQQLTHPKPKKVIKPKKPAAIYHITAIVPGRVWLQSADGKVISVRVGDKLEGYGKVELISPRQGKVITSSGALIQYGSNDF
jgi:hypothetical protein